MGVDSDGAQTIEKQGLSDCDSAFAEDAFKAKQNLPQGRFFAFRYLVKNLLFGSFFGGCFFRGSGFAGSRFRGGFGAAFAAFAINLLNGHHPEFFILTLRASGVLPDEVGCFADSIFITIYHHLLQIKKVWFTTLIYMQNFIRQ